MARIAFEIPKIGLVMEAVKLQRWLKNVGDEVRVGEPLLEVETEKSVVEIEAAFSGRLVEVLMPEGAEARVGDQVAWLEADAATAAAVTAAHAPATAAAPTTLPASPAVPDSAPSETGGRIRSSPVARRLAIEHGLDLAGVEGSGPRGRVQLADVRTAVAARDGSPGTPGELPPMRRALARAMTLSNATIPQFTLVRAADMTTLQAARAALALAQAPRAPRLSINDFLLQALARTLIAYPALNATFSGHADSRDARIVPASGAHIGLVVAVNDGLLVPVLHGVEQLGLGEIARRRIDCVERGLAGRLRREELEGATCSLSNLGQTGPDCFGAIINPPQSAILAVGRLRDCAVVRDGAVVVRPVCELTLTVDHRVADGRLAADFLTFLCALIEGENWLS